MAYRRTAVIEKLSCPWSTSFAAFVGWIAAATIAATAQAAVAWSTASLFMPMSNAPVVPRAFGTAVMCGMRIVTQRCDSAMTMSRRPRNDRGNGVRFYKS